MTEPSTYLLPPTLAEMRECTQQRTYLAKERAERAAPKHAPLTIDEQVDLDFLLMDAGAYE